MKIPFFAFTILLFSAITLAQSLNADDIPAARELVYPIENYVVNNSHFLNQDTYDGVWWGFHLGEDMEITPGTSVMAIGDGVVVYSGNHPGRWRETAQGREMPVRNWGNIIVVSHRNPATDEIFQSVYGHLGQRLVEEGDEVTKGQIIGDVGMTDTPENGMWFYPHLHFAIYSGPQPWIKPSGAPLAILPGYFHPEQGATKIEWWKEPSKFIREYPGGKQ